MKKAGKYARPIGFRAKNSPCLCNCYFFLFISKLIHFTLENNTWFLIVTIIEKSLLKR